ncbi:hypothetical protein SDRG_09640 [Saprolegnia diclina VS20]|uniref:BZIP domain-containing protein n=1 Tax=Saprolegnia diclina (strain VS20) TaxID=1156394 RepID=T0Q4A2_SAPDV|nr:hypothetical protein SDRG_09640 [Saprolegnia diclina VS20]EQC32664.1 hypothetical protein SDRG_09640 [Saprolegnia diclina VS20]|eukprot:XP_008613808.1 hypothetical protein SDRG_09640 [Saprolegnia diclina VS20]
MSAPPPDARRRPPRPPPPTEDEHLLYVRHRRKMNKRKLRAEQKRRTESLEDDVAALTNDTNQLQHHLYDMTSALPAVPASSMAMESLLRHYFELFAHGWDASRHEQMDVELRTLLRPDVVFMDDAESGIEKVMEQWRRCCTCYGAFHMSVRDLMPIDHRFMRAHIIVALEVTDQTLQALFPHVYSHPSLPSRLLGSRLHVPVELHIAMDMHFKVSRLDVAVDYVTAFRAHVEDLDDVAEVLASTLPSGELMVAARPPQY